MKRSKAKFLVLGLGLMILYSGLATVDLWRLSENPAWSGFQKFRINTHLEVISLTTVVVPPIGPLALVHHSGRLLDAYVDQHEAPAYTMRYLRGLVMEAPDCQEKVTAHEKAYKQGRSGRHGTITCEVPFVLGTGDSFSIYVYSERNGKEVTTAFLVHGLGLSPTTEKQSPMYLFRGVPEPWKTRLEPTIRKLDSLITQLKKQQVSRDLWINLTETDDTSRYSDKDHRLKKPEWTKKVKERNRAGKGLSAEELFALYR